LKERATVTVAGHRAIIEDLKIATGADGIAAKDADDGIVRRSEIDWIPEGVTMASKGNGIDLYNSHRWRMEDNIIRDVHDGIYMEQSDDGSVIGNRIERSRYGIHCMYTARSLLRDNEGHANVTGAMVMTAREAEVTGNVFTKQNENVHSQGILLFDAHDSLFESNVVEGNRAGLYVEESTGNRFMNNRVAYNFVGLQLLNAEKNVFAGNLFQGNVADAEARGSSDNDISGNYWDGHSGIDADGDGYSDMTYAINPFFQGLTQKRAAFQLLFQSPGMAFLEGLYGTNRDDWSTDSKPLMAPPLDDASSGSSDDAQATVYISLALLALVVTVLYKNRRRLQ
jgi:nitrous oxidase accessory protein